MMRETKTLKGLFPDPKPPQRKNFIKENVRNLRKMEQIFHNNNKSANDLKLPVLKQTRISNKLTGLGDSQIVSSKENLQDLNIDHIIDNEIPKLLTQKTFFGEHKINKRNANVPNKNVPSQKISKQPLNSNIRKNQNRRYKVDLNTESRNKLKAFSESNVVHEKLNEIAHDNEINVGSKCQAVQTLDAKDMENLYLEGVIRYPSGTTKEKKGPKSAFHNNETQQSENNEKDIKNASDSSLYDNVDYVKLNKERISIASKLASQLHNGERAPPINYKFGVVPKYIKERKEALQKEQEAKAAAKHSDCPTGHVPVPDDERKNTLSILHKNYKEYVNELNMLPIRTDTLRSQRRKMEIEKQLVKLEEAIKIFSRPKVFVTIDS